ncbi:MAG TPA: ABC transporter permease [Ramlibacter sp.]|uniref:ABC transporter permease n=1 Tax=Ramlibacter sp. TaxID=1917967 RepID=UPI002C811C8B|nr:ABC transporter permease [Ramlibacter sp.]HVZ46400.1 ABC transporter permease [Ramlibacter sp.]
MSSLVTYLVPWRHAGLIRQFAERDVHARYRASWLGLGWAVLTPLLTLAVYTFVFRHIFGVRWGSAPEGSNIGFAVRLYCGLALFNFFAECVSRAPRVVLDQPHLVKKVRFPLEVLPWASALAAGVHLAIALVLLLALSWWDSGRLPATLVALPLVWLPLAPLVVGLGWWLAALGAYIRDIGQLIALLLSLLMFMSPIFFPLEAVPAALRPWLVVNPLAPLITGTRQVLLEGTWPSWSALALNFAVCVAIAAGGAAFFRAVRPGFAEVV